MVLEVGGTQSGTVLGGFGRFWEVCGAKWRMFWEVSGGGMEYDFGYPWGMFLEFVGP